MATVKEKKGTAGEPVSVVEPAVEAPYPEALAAPGDEFVVGRIGDLVGQVTDVGSLATVLGLVVKQCRTYRVRPEVVKAALGE